MIHYSLSKVTSSSLITDRNMDDGTISTDKPVNESEKGRRMLKGKIEDGVQSQISIAYQIHQMKPHAMEENKVRTMDTTW